MGIINQDKEEDKMSRWIVVKNVVSEVRLPRYDVSLYYWWPGRVFKQPSELPFRFRQLIKAARRSKSKYIVFASADIVDGLALTPVHGYSRCMSIDVPSKIYGRNRAIGKLLQKLLIIGYTIIEAPEEG